ncbi:methylthioribose kinase-like [Mytilus edulis]|uniref:methylthioribose kinase-like n=1 Tax=Mytilus edulis TaxID=6550 RepID=UPI0039EE71EB
MSAEDNTTMFENVKRICHDNRGCKGLEFATNVSDLVVEEVGDGNLNDVFRILSPTFKGRNSAVAKRGPPYIKCLGPEYPLTINRNKVEYDALLKFDSIIPGCVPKPLCRATDENIYFMEDLKDYELMRHLLIKGVNCEEAILKLAQNIVHVHKETQVSKLSQKEKQELAENFKNEEMVALTNKFVFTAPFVNGEPTNQCADNVRPLLPQIYDDPNVLQTAEKMRKLFLEKKECLLHGDLHTGAVMCTSDGKDPKMMDIEFAFVGPCAFDVGMFLANLIFTYYQHMSTQQDNDTHRQYAYGIVNLGKRFVKIYMEHMTCISGSIEHFMSEVTGFCGCELIRRTVGVAHVEDFKDSEFGEQEALGAGIRLLQAVDRIETVDKLMVIALMLA